jgi:hypothetical protein
MYLMVLTVGNNTACEARCHLNCQACQALSSDEKHHKWRSICGGYNDGFERGEIKKLAKTPQANLVRRVFRRSRNGPCRPEAQLLRVWRVSGSGLKTEIRSSRRYWSPKAKLLICHPLQGSCEHRFSRVRWQRSPPEGRAGQGKLI